MTRRAMPLDYLPVRQGSGRADGAVRGALDKPRPFKRGTLRSSRGQRRWPSPRGSVPQDSEGRAGRAERRPARGGHAPCLAPPPYASSEAGASAERHILHISAPSNPRRGCLPLGSSVSVPSSSRKELRGRSPLLHPPSLERGDEGRGRVGPRLRLGAKTRPGRMEGVRPRSGRARPNLTPRPSNVVKWR